MTADEARRAEDLAERVRREAEDDVREVVFEEVRGGYEEDWAALAAEVAAWRRARSLTAAEIAYLFGGRE